MRVVEVTDDGALELQWMWLPTFIGQNYQVQQELKQFLQKCYPKGLPNTPEDLDEANSVVITWLAGRFPGVDGLIELLQALKGVRSR